MTRVIIFEDLLACTGRESYSMERLLLMNNFHLHFPSAFGKAHYLSIIKPGMMDVPIALQDNHEKNSATLRTMTWRMFYSTLYKTMERCGVNKTMLREKNILYNRTSRNHRELFVLLWPILVVMAKQGFNWHDLCA